MAEIEFGPFLTAVRGAYGAARDADGELTADLDIWLAALDGLGGARVPVEPEYQPVCRYLNEALDLAEAESAGAGPVAAIAAAARPFAAGLGWRHPYRIDDRLPGFSQSYAHADIVGDSSPVPSPDMFCGFLLMAPRTFYPSHRHAAVELYLVLGGTAEWQRGAEPWRAARPAPLSCTAPRSATPCALSRSRCSRSMPGTGIWSPTWRCRSKTSEVFSAPESLVTLAATRFSRIKRKAPV